MVPRLSQNNEDESHNFHFCSPKPSLKQTVENTTFFVKHFPFPRRDKATNVQTWKDPIRSSIEEQTLAHLDSQHDATTARPTSPILSHLLEHMCVCGVSFTSHCTTLKNRVVGVGPILAWKLLIKVPIENWQPYFEGAFSVLYIFIGNLFKLLFVVF